MKNLYFKNDFIKESRLVFLAMHNRPVEARAEAPKPETSPEINDEAHQALDRVARYRDELSKRLDKMDKNNPKYKLFEKTYNELTVSQEKLEKTISDNDPKRDEVVNNTFNKINEILKNPHLSIVRSLMIQKQLKEVKKAFTEEIGHLKADSVIPLISMMSRHKNGASVEDGRTYEVPGILVRREGDNIKLVINDKLYEFSTKVINGKWHFFDKKGNPLKDLTKNIDKSNGAGVLGGLDEEDYKQQLGQRPTKVSNGPELIKRVTEIKKTKEEKNEFKITPDLRNSELGDLHFGKTVIEDSPILKQYLNSINKTPFQKFESEITNMKGEKQNLAVFISTVKDKNITYYRISTAASKPGTKETDSYKTDYWPKEGAGKLFYGKDPIAEKVSADAVEKKEEMERNEQNEKNFNVFKNTYKGKFIDIFIENIQSEDKPLNQLLSELGLKPPFTSPEAKDVNGTIFRLILESNEKGGNLKLEVKRPESNFQKYVALEKSGNDKVIINQPPKKLTDKEAFSKLGHRYEEKDLEPKNVKEWREAALKSANSLLEKVKSNDAMKQFANDLIKAEGIKMDGRTIEDKAEKYSFYMNIAVRFKNKITYAMDSLQNPGAPLKALEENVNNALAILPKNSQNIYMAKFKKNIEENIMLARTKSTEEDPNKQV